MPSYFAGVSCFLVVLKRTFNIGIKETKDKALKSAYKALKKISISPKTTVFLLLAIGIIFIALLFYTLETLLVFGLIYVLSIPISIFIYKRQNKKDLKKISDEDHEDIL